MCVARGERRSMTRTTTTTRGRREAIHVQCLRLFKTHSFVCADSVKPALRRLPGEARVRVQRHLQALCANKKLTRAGRGQYAPSAPVAAEQAVPTQVFPYQGSKRRMTVLLASVLRNEMAIGKRKSILSAFAGTGVVEGTLRNLGIKVHAVDLNHNIVNVHLALRTSRRRAMVIKHLRNETTALRRCSSEAARKQRFRKVLRDGVLKSRRTTGCTLSAARWILGQKMAFLGMLTRTSVLDVDRVKSFDVDQAARQVACHVGIGDCCSHTDAFTAIRRAAASQLLFLDPPYLCEKQPTKSTKCRQYSAGDFGLEEHKQLAEALKGKHFVLCHRDSPEIRALYEDCEIITAAPIMQLNRVGASRNELLIIGRPSRGS